jgi:hypothetical protein
VWLLQELAFQRNFALRSVHRLLVTANVILGSSILVEDNIYTINKNTGTLIDASKEVGIAVNVEKTKHMLVSRDQNAGQDRDIKIGNRSFEMCHSSSISERQ